MMGRSIVFLGFLGAAFLPAMVLFHLISVNEQKIYLHAIVALIPCLLVAFSHSWVLIYLAGASKIIGEASRENDFDLELSSEAERLKRKTRPWLITGIICTLSTSILGAFHWYGSVGIWPHRLAFGVSIIAVVGAMILSWGALKRSEEQIQTVDRLLESRE